MYRPSREVSPESPDNASSPYSIDTLGPYSFLQLRSGHKVTDAPFLLVDFLPPLGAEDSIMDIGSSTGVIPLMLAWKTTVKKIVGVELQPHLVETARKNVEKNALGGRVRFLEGDYRDLPKRLPRGCFSFVVGNPPFIKAGAGRMSPDTSRDVARREVFGTLGDILNVSAYLVGDYGRVAYIFPVIRLEEMLSGLVMAGLTPNRLRFIHTAPEKGASLFLIEASSSGTLEVEAPLILNAAKTWP